MHFGEQLKALRKELDSSQVEMADRLCIDKSTYCRWEKKEVPSPHMVARVQKAFGVDAWSWLKPEAGEPGPNHERTEPRVVHLRNEPAHSQDDGNEADRIELLNRFLDLFERIVGRRRGGVATSCFSAN